ncbi:hypothetical protein Cgig2_023812 [Carnegiea gigantea]|uniref:Uncharacterized protein n=1 Tax=Carnegiea gigantea TaxID=171969 RepID=A0A9Q1Q8S6_9CARY|nr:hypothetical protein Cgig2_023812 [Carnegiea gigantea]
MLGLFPESDLKNLISVLPHPRLKGALAELRKSQLHYAERPPMQNAQPLGFDKKHCVENNLGQFWELKALSSFLSHSKFIARAQGLKIVQERQRRRSNPASIPLEVILEMKDGAPILVDHILYPLMGRFPKPPSKLRGFFHHRCSAGSMLGGYMTVDNEATISKTRRYTPAMGIFHISPDYSLGSTCRQNRSSVMTGGDVMQSIMSP